MNEKTLLKQVLLSREISPELSGWKTRLAQDVFWIDSKFAKKNQRVVDEDGIIWTVSEVYGAKEVSDLQKEFAAWRRFRDVLDGD